MFAYCNRLVGQKLDGKAIYQFLLDVTTISFDLAIFVSH